VDGMDVLAVEAVAQRAAAHVREGKGPFFIEARTYRFRAHSAYDPELYRTKEEVERWKSRDPIPALAAALGQAGLLEEGGLARLEAEADREVEAAVRFAEDSPWEPVEDLLRDVHAAPGAGGAP
jgi:pyruvate dehydrogenase E1 component alpha subunit